MFPKENTITLHPSATTQRIGSCSLDDVHTICEARLRMSCQVQDGEVQTVNWLFPSKIERDKAAFAIFHSCYKKKAILHSLL